MASDALGDAMMISNPRPATEEEIVALYEQAYLGDPADYDLTGD